MAFTGKIQSIEFDADRLLNSFFAAMAQAGYSYDPQTGRWTQNSGQ